MSTKRHEEPTHTPHDDSVDAGCFKSLLESIGKIFDCFGNSADLGNNIAEMEQKRQEAVQNAQNPQGQASS
jgi:hypothetical protein